METRRKLVVVGDGTCGKTSLLMSFKDNHFPDDYIPTVFESYVTDIEIDSKKFELSLFLLQ